jgi:hypothetical protein
VHTLDLEIFQALNSSNQSAFFINKPIRNLAKLTVKDSDDDKINPNGIAMFHFFYGIPGPDYKSYDDEDLTIVLKKDVGTDELKPIANYTNTIRKRNNWELSDGYQMNKIEDSKYTLGSDLINNPGKYVVELTVGNELVQYGFEVKDGKIISSEYPELNDRGSYWLKGMPVETPKYEGFKPVGNFAGVKNNIRMMQASADKKTSKGVGENVPVIFGDGEGLSVSVSNTDELKKKFAYQNVERIATLLKGNEILAQKILYGPFTNQFPYVAYMHDVEMKADYVVYEFMEALAKLPAGNHELTFVLELASGKKYQLAGVQKIAFKSAAGNPKYLKQAELIKERMSMSENELADIRRLKYAGEDWALYENNCGRTVWLRQDESKEYYLYPGNKGMFDRNAGTLEQWNFGTRKWLPIDDFKPYASYFKITENSLAMYQMKQIPKDMIEKLRTIVGVQFNTATEFMKKVEGLIGAENASKYETQIQTNSRVDLVKVCK